MVVRGSQFQMLAPLYSLICNYPHSKMRPYIFIHIPQTGGTSLWSLLGTKPSHKTAAELYPDYSNKEWDELFVFSLTRNPYDRAVALYLERYLSNAYGMLEDQISFLDFLILTLVKKRSPYFDNYYLYSPQKYWLENKYGRVVVPHLYPFEQYNRSVLTILKIIGIDTSEPFTIPHLHNVHQANWRTYYLGEEGRQAAKIVQQAWEDDFTYLNYTRNSYEQEKNLAYTI